MLLPDSKQFRRVTRMTSFVIGILLSVIACGMLAVHARSFSLKRDTAVMIGTTLPELRSSVALLAANLQAEQFFSENALSAREEQASVYVLPDSRAAGRTVASFQTIAGALRDTLKTEGSIRTMTFDDSSVGHSDYKTIGAHLQMSGDFRYVSTFLSILSFSGKMMIRDVLSDDAVAAFLKQINASAPLSLKAAEDFLYTDLLEYAANPDQVEQRMLQDLPTETQPDVRSFVLSSGLASVRTSLTEIAPALRNRNVWPLPFVTVDSLSRSGDAWTIGLTFYRR